MNKDGSVHSINLCLSLKVEIRAQAITNMLLLRQSCIWLYWCQLLNSMTNPKGLTVEETNIGNKWSDQSSMCLNQCRVPFSFIVIALVTPANTWPHYSYSLENLQSPTPQHPSLTLTFFSKFKLCPLYSLS